MFRQLGGCGDLDAVSAISAKFVEPYEFGFAYEDNALLERLGPVFESRVPGNSSTHSHLVPRLKRIVTVGLHHDPVVVVVAAD